MIKFLKQKSPECQEVTRRFLVSLGALIFSALFLWPGWGFLFVPIPQTFGTLITDGLIILILALWGTRILKLPGPGQIKVQDLIWGPATAIGLIILSVIFGIIGRNLEWIPSQAPRSTGSGPLEMLIFTLIIGALKEETFYRWFFFKTLEALKLRPLAIILIQGLLFSMAHQYQGLWWTFFSAVAGIILGFLVYKTRRLWPAVIGHGVYNGLISIL